MSNLVLLFSKIIILIFIRRITLSSENISFGFRKLQLKFLFIFVFLYSFRHYSYHCIFFLLLSSSILSLLQLSHTCFFWGGTFVFCFLWLLIFLELCVSLYLKLFINVHLFPFCLIFSDVPILKFSTSAFIEI